MLTQLKVQINGKIKFIDLKSFKSKDGQLIEYKELTIDINERENATLRIIKNSPLYDNTEVKEGSKIQGEFIATPVYVKGINYILLKA